MTLEIVYRSRSFIWLTTYNNAGFLFPLSLNDFPGKVSQDRDKRKGGLRDEGRREEKKEKNERVTDKVELFMLNPFHSEVLKVTFTTISVVFFDFSCYF